MVDISPSDQPEQVKKIIKILVVGEMGTGKTSLIRQYVQGFFSEFYKTTIGVDFANKEIKRDDNITISLQLWDIAGQERYGNMTRVYYQEACAAFVVFDVTRTTSLDLSVAWKNDIDEKVFTSQNKPIPCLLLGNKIDLCAEGKWAKTKEEMDQFVNDNKFIGFFETSARNGTNIDEAVNFLVNYILDNKIEPFVESNKGVVINDDHPKPTTKSGCCS